MKLRKITFSTWIQLAGLVVAVLTIVWSNSARFYRLEYSIEILGSRIDVLERRMNSFEATMKEMLHDHDKRITVLEHNAKNR